MFNLKTAAIGQNENKKREIRFTLIPTLLFPKAANIGYRQVFWLVQTSDVFPTQGQ